MTKLFRALLDMQVRLLKKCYRQNLFVNIESILTQKVKNNGIEIIKNKNEDNVLLQNFIE